MSLKRVVENMPGYNKLVLPLHWAQAVRATTKYKRPAKQLRVIAVTGTNGKTTTCFMIWKMLTTIGYKTGLLTTVGWSEDGETIHRQYEHMTTERVDVLNQRMRAIADAGSEFMVLEVTSHALAQYRTLGVPIEIAVFTNLTHEHLDYHKTFDNYRKAKMRLFRQAKAGVVNADDPSASYFVGLFKGQKKAGSNEKNALGDIITYGIEKGDIRATDIQLNSFGVDYACGDMEIRTQIPGKFNVYNSLAAVAVGKKLGFKNEQIERGIHALESVEGRMNRIREGQDFEVIVDYAHTPDALEKVFLSVQGSSSERITSSDPPVRARRMSNTPRLRSSNLPRTSSQMTSPLGGDDSSRTTELLKSDSLSRTTSPARTLTAKTEKNSIVAELIALPSGLGDDAEVIESAPVEEINVLANKEPKKTVKKAVKAVTKRPVEVVAEPIEVTERRIISVHGGAGRRDESTRAVRGKILGKYSDIVIITEDDSRDEDPRKIAEQFVEGAESAGKVMGKDLFAELDRRKAIEQALKMAKKGDLVLILGKGHEKTILRADGPHEFEDVKVATEILRGMRK